MPQGSPCSFPASPCPQRGMTAWGQPRPWHTPLLDTNHPFFCSGTRTPTTNSLTTTRAIVGCILTSLFTSSSPRCLGSCGTSFRKSPRRRFSQTPRPPGCSVSPRLGKDLPCLFRDAISVLLGSCSFAHPLVRSPHHRWVFAGFVHGADSSWAQRRMRDMPFS